MASQSNVAMSHGDSNVTDYESRSSVYVGPDYMISFIQCIDFGACYMPNSEERRQLMNF